MNPEVAMDPSGDGEGPSSSGWAHLDPVFIRIALDLGLDPEDLAQRLGSQSNPWRGWQGDFLGICDYGSRIAGSPKAWLTSPNTGPLFQGHAPLDLILEDPFGCLEPFLTYLQSVMLGWDTPSETDAGRLAVRKVRITPR